MAKIIYKDVLKKEIKNIKESKQKLIHLATILKSLKGIKSNTEKNTDINQLIKYIENRIDYINKRTNNIDKIVIEKDEYKIQLENVEKIKNDMEQGLLVIVVEPLEFIKALSLYISSVDISLNYNNIMSYIRELNNYFIENNLSVISQQYLIKYFINLLEKIDNKFSKEENRKYEVRELIRYLSNFKYNDIKTDELSFQSIEFDTLDSYLRSNIKLSKVPSKLDIYSDSE